MAARTVLLSGALVLSSGVVAGPGAIRADEKPKVAAVSVDLSGDWVFNSGLSDDARQKMREGLEKAAGSGAGRPPGGGAGGSGGGARGGPPPGALGGDDDPGEAMRGLLEPAEELTIIQTPAQVAMEEKFGETRRLHPDGKKYKTDNGSAEVKAFWKDGQLVVETRRGPAGRVVETWERVPDGSQLIVSVKVEGGFGPSLTLKRVWDRAPGVGAK
jgi:hypothetical protein